MTVIDSFAGFSCALNAPEEARHAARRCILDWFGAALAGSVCEPATLLRQAFPGSGPARLLPDGDGRDARTAALINGTASHTVEVDDIFRSGLYHPGVVTIPAALALGEAESAGGARFVDAVIAGYEVSNRIARAVNPAHYAHWHTTGTVGHFGGAVAAAVVLGLNPVQTANAMATVATFAAGLRHAFSADAMSKPIHAGRAAEAGVTAALMARSGITGVGDMLEGERGFGVSMSGQIDWEAALSTLGEEWTICNTTPKAHACCGHNFAALDAIRILMTEHGIAPGAIGQVEIASYRAVVDICGNPDPATAAEARFSLPWCAATMARKGAVTPAAFTDNALTDAATRDMASRVTLAIDPQAETRFPHARSATVRLHLIDGRVLEHHRPTRKGDPDDPMSDEDLLGKFHDLADPIIGRGPAIELSEAIDSLGHISGLGEFPVGHR